MSEVEGTCDERFAGVRDALAASLDTSGPAAPGLDTSGPAAPGLAGGGDLGASVAVVLDGEPVVDLWGGYADAARTRPWERDTIVNVFSTTKTVTALSVLILADRGLVDLEAPVARYWPEFAAGGKEGVLVRHVMGHTAGLSGWEKPMSVGDLYDWDLATSRLAAQAPWWEPGTASGYHALTQGYLLGEIVRRVTGRTLGRFVADEVAGPLGADFHIGLDPAHDGRVAELIPAGPLAVGNDPAGISARTLGNPPLRAAEANRDAWRRAEIPAGNGHGNARSVARIQSVLACGGQVDGVRLLSPAGCDAVFAEQAHGVDLVLGVPLRLGVGYGINGPEAPLSPNPRTCYWGGWGGSLVVVDLDARLVVAYAMNQMAADTLGDLRGGTLVFAAYRALASS